MAAYVEDSGIEFPVCLDAEAETNSAYLVDGYPDYYLIDRAGDLRVADLANKDLDRAIEVLLKEEPPAPQPPPVVGLELVREVQKTLGLIPIPHLDLRPGRRTVSRLGLAEVPEAPAP